MGDVKIRRARTSDLYTLTEMHVELNKELARHTVRCPEELLERGVVQSLLRRYLPGQDFTVWLASVGDDEAGFMSTSIEMVPIPVAPIAVGEILNLYVRPQYRQMGIGTALFETALAHFHRAGVRSIELSYLIANEGAAKFWARHGFIPESTRAVLVLDRPRPSGQ